MLHLAQPHITGPTKDNPLESLLEEETPPAKPVPTQK